MASPAGSSQLAALCAVASFIWLARSIENHQLIEQPRLSALLCLLISGVAAFVASFFSLWLPGANGRFDDDLGVLRLSRVSLPRKPRRYFLPCLVVCIILRLEAFHRVSYDIQCSSPGIESWLPLFVVAYELLRGRGPRPDADEKFYDEIHHTIFDDIGQWIHEIKLSLIIGILTLSYGVYLSSLQGTRSTFFCSSLGNPSLVLFLQWAGLFLDTSIVVLFWRILASARTTKSRLKTLSGILLTTAGGVGVLHSISRFLQRSNPMSSYSGGLDSLYAFDTAVDGMMLSVFLISASLLTTEGSPLSLVGIVTFLSGILSAIQQTSLIGTWENVSPTTSYLALIFICNGFAFFVYANNLRSVVFVHRAFIVLILILITLAATIFTIIVGSRAIDGHPIERLVYDGRVEGDRWLINAKVSGSLPVAVREYVERHDGRPPPRGFDTWFKFAMDRNSPVLDNFAQMERDLSPFWGIAPEMVRDGVRQAADEHDIVLVKIKNGTPIYDSVSGASASIMDDIMAMIKSFGEHLPDLEFAVNLDERPRVLASWDKIPTGKHSSLGKLLSRRSSTDGAALRIDRIIGNYTRLRDLREMTALACAPGTKSRSGVHWDVRDICTPCLQPQSPDSQYLADWPQALELCHQPDLFRLHGFHMTAQPNYGPLPELLPVFSRSKTDSYSDILIPLRRHDESLELVDTDVKFQAKQKKLFWRGKLDGNPDKELLQGGHQERLIHLINNASKTDEVTILLPGSNRPGTYSYEHASAAELNNLLPIDVGFIGPSRSCGEDCAARHEFGFKEDTDEESIIAQSLTNQYVLVMDTDNGPPKGFLPVLRSGSVPFLSSIFKEWYTERLLPWVHFVPIDIRFHALHGTLAYFTGIGETGEVRLNGRDVKLDGKPDNAKWIAEQGRGFASKALRREDMEVYLFRLLLEWARLVDDNRDKMGFTLP
ncbi:glycosyltransferase family 90 protein [Cercophora newfieldiana]|uniref:Glycosyltransferase family 90 protein n=1 Tax=Cercophora newfieldiana TaxID=92897 RepID=A0AA39YS71_9PEZI|nr:glycosyltransferase family 90 protein [Cercophora newfieldiana]